MKYRSKPVDVDAQQCADGTWIVLEDGQSRVVDSEYFQRHYERLYEDSPIDDAPPAVARFDAPPIE